MSYALLYTKNHILKIEVTFAEVKRQLLQEEHEQVEKGQTVMNLDDGSPSAFIIEGLELEETQYVIFQPIVDLCELIYKI